MIKGKKVNTGILAIIVVIVMLILMGIPIACQPVTTLDSNTVAYPTIAVEGEPVYKYVDWQNNVTCYASIYGGIWCIKQ